MADQAKTLLLAYKTAITNAMAAGEPLEYLQSVEIIDDPDTLPSDWAAPLPFVLIRWVSTDITPDSLGAYRSNRKTYHIRLSALLEFYDDQESVIGNATAGTQGILDVAEDLEDLFDRNTLSTSTECLLTNVSSEQVPRFAGLHQVHLDFEHLYYDRRTS